VLWITSYLTNDDVDNTYLLSQYPPTVLGCKRNICQHGFSYVGTFTVRSDDEIYFNIDVLSGGVGHRTKKGRRSSLNPLPGKPYVAITRVAYG
jgi:hypothetical protein